MINFAVLALTIIIIFSLYLRWSIRLCKSKASMKGKVVIVTGANAGIGLHTAEELARRGARVILACRHEGRGIAARDVIAAKTGNEEVIYRHLDLSCLKSVRQFAAHILDTENKLHVLVNNAGVFGFAHRHTEDGILETLQINYFGHFLLTLLLLPLLKKSRPSRVVNLSSILHFFGHIDVGTINEKKYLWNDFSAYSNSKLCMLLFTKELCRRLAGCGVVVNAVHPGVILTGIVTTSTPWMWRALFWIWAVLYRRSAAQGAQTVVQLAVAEECATVSGEYFVDCASRLISWEAASHTKAKELWDYSAKLVGIQEENNENKV